MSTGLVSHGHWHHWVSVHRSHVSHRSAVRSRTPTTLATHERILTRAELVDGGQVVGTDRALHVRSKDSAWRRIGWIDIASAAWSRAEASTVVRLWPIDHNASFVVQATTGASFAAFAAERVASTQLLCRRVQLTPVQAACITALREPGDDVAIWAVRLVPGCEVDNPLVAAAAAQILAEMRAQSGC